MNFVCFCCSGRERKSRAIAESHFFRVTQIRQAHNFIDAQLHHFHFEPFKQYNFSHIYLIFVVVVVVVSVLVVCVTRYSFCLIRVCCCLLFKLYQSSSGISDTYIKCKHCIDFIVLYMWFKFELE